MNEEEQYEKQVTDAKAHQASKDVLSTGAKAAGTYFGGAAGGKVVDAISKTGVGDKILDSAADTVNSVLPEPAKKVMADNQKKISTVSKIADKAITSSPEAINTDNTGYNPYLDVPKPSNNGDTPTINPQTINQDVEKREEPSEELKEQSKKHSKENNIDDEATGTIKIPPILIAGLPVFGILALFIFLFLPMIHDYVNNDANFNYQYTNLSACGRVIILEEFEEHKSELEALELQISETTDSEELADLEKTKRTLVPSYSLDDYIAGVIEHEVGGFKDSNVFYAFALAARTYLFNNSYIEDNYCYISNSTNTQMFTKPEDQTNDEIKEIVTKTHDYVLVDLNNNYVSTEYDAFCLASENDEYYYIEQKNQAFPKDWIEEQIGKFGDPEWLEEPCSGGHGRGMSQYGAYYLSTVNDYGWKDILSYYYGPNIFIRKVAILDMDEEGNTLYSGEVVGSADLPVSTGGYAWPVAGMDAPNTCSRGIGVDEHTGMDIRRAQGTPVYAAKSGTVVGIGIVGTNGLHWSYGNGVQIRTDDNFINIYAHFDQPPFVTMGQRVEQGQQIGVVGTTGNSTGYHLHFEVHDPAGRKVDPATLLSGLPACCGRGRTCPR